MTTSSEFDYVTFDGETNEQAIETMKVESGADVTVEVVQQVGPGGGCPVGKVTGPREELVKFFTFHDFDLESHGLELDPE